MRVRMQVTWPPAANAELPMPSVRECLLQAVTSACGEELQLHWMGNAPMAHFPEPDEGAPTLFFWRIQNVRGAVKLAAGVDDYCWLTKEEIAERLGGDLGVLVLEMCGPSP